MSGKFRILKEPGGKYYIQRKRWFNWFGWWSTVSTSYSGMFGDEFFIPHYFDKPEEAEDYIKKHFGEQAEKARLRRERELERDRKFVKEVTL